MFHKKSLRQHTAQGAGWGLFAGTVGWIVLLMQGAAIMRSQAVDSSHEITIGPLLLNTFIKDEYKEGFRATISFEPGLLWYTLICVLLGGGIALLSAQIRARG